jgi:hypothetical protein
VGVTGRRKSGSHARRWPWVVAVGIVALVVAGAFFALHGNESRSGTDAIRAVAQYDDALAAGNARRACQLLAPESQTAIVTAARPFGDLTCDQILSRAVARLSPEARQRIGDARINVVRIFGNRVRVAVSFGDRKKDTELWVVRLRGRWLVGPPLRGA